MSIPLVVISSKDHTQQSRKGRIDSEDTYTIIIQEVDTKEGKRSFEGEPSPNPSKRPKSNAGTPSKDAVTKPAGDDDGNLEESTPKRKSPKKEKTKKASPPKTSPKPATPEESDALPMDVGKATLDERPKKKGKQSQGASKSAVQSLPSPTGTVARTIASSTTPSSSAFTESSILPPNLLSNVLFRYVKIAGVYMARVRISPEDDASVFSKEQYGGHPCLVISKTRENQDCTAFPITSYGQTNHNSEKTPTLHHKEIYLPIRAYAFIPFGRIKMDFPWTASIPPQGWQGKGYINTSFRVHFHFGDPGKAFTTVTHPSHRDEEREECTVGPDGLAYACKTERLYWKYIDAAGEGHFDTLGFVEEAKALGDHYKLLFDYGDGDGYEGLGPKDDQEDEDEREDGGDGRNGDGQTDEGGHIGHQGGKDGGGDVLGKRVGGVTEEGSAGRRSRGAGHEEGRDAMDDDRGGDSNGKRIEANVNKRSGGKRKRSEFEATTFTSRTEQHLNENNPGQHHGKPSENQGFNAEFRRRWERDGVQPKVEMEGLMSVNDAEELEIIDSDIFEKICFAQRDWELVWRPDEPCLSR
ncbi:hypothetical protein BJ508DRAFT_332463 [Ascobolus immersus RN42]|uniref:Uncharacterized protein n=1 Tax=Ascobolus immersus RN42 TaxID=1160509 RepID=A0A3N4HSU7_ASCIM|nr:hypothetical protein BJ508DRAFT_332463 [Ascobolus immersus RN42]